MTTLATTALETVVPGLYASPPERLPFGRALEIRAYLLQRPRGNVLVYRSAGLLQEADAIDALGGVSRQYLNHSHEASPACDRVAGRFGAPLIVHAADQPAASEACRVTYTFSRRHLLDEDFEAIPTPGHTPGATAYLWDSGEHRVLFTGDTIYLRDGQWVAAVLGGSDRERYLESLDLIRELDFDLLVPGIATAGEPHFAFTDPVDRRDRVGAIIERLRAGGDR